MARVHAQGHPKGKKTPASGCALHTYGDLESVLQLLPEGVYAFCAGAHARLGAVSPCASCRGRC